MRSARLVHGPRESSGGDGAKMMCSLCAFQSQVGTGYFVHVFQTFLKPGWPGFLGEPAHSPSWCSVASVCFNCS